MTVTLEQLKEIETKLNELQDLVGALRRHIPTGERLFCPTCGWQGYTSELADEEHCPDCSHKAGKSGILTQSEEATNDRNP